MLFVQDRPFVLASGSPRRKEYFEKYHLQFQILTSDVDETPQTGESPLDFACRMARDKGLAVADRAAGRVVISADTIVVLKGQILGKPANRAEVLPMLQRLNGQAHQVITAYQILEPGQKQGLVRWAETGVLFRRLDEALLKAYSLCDEPLDKAGSYSIQGMGTFLVDSIQGSFNNVVGLPIELLIQDLLLLGHLRPQLQG